MCNVLELKLDLQIAIPIQLAFITVPTLKMLGLGVEIVSAFICMNDCVFFCMYTIDLLVHHTAKLSKETIAFCYPLCSTFLFLLFCLDIPSVLRVICVKFNMHASNSL